MDLVLDEEQLLLQRAARDFVAARSPLARARKGETSREVWSEMAKLGWLGLTIGEAYGGAGLGHRHAAVVLEELGRNLVPEPLVSTIACAVAIEAGGDDAQKRAHLPAIASGERLVALAYQEARSRFALGAIDTTADEAGSGFVLDGEKTHVEAGSIADLFVVSARTGRYLSEVALFVVSAKERGVTVTREARLDGRASATVRFEPGRSSHSIRTSPIMRVSPATVSIGSRPMPGMSSPWKPR